MNENQDSRLGCKWTLEEDIEMCKLREQGYSFKEIGKLLKRSEKSCATRYSNRGYTLNPLKLLINMGIVLLSLTIGINTEPTNLF
jgi:Myb superfamily proteins, including transcription factors and mRNA splicing factors